MKITKTAVLVSWLISQSVSANILLDTKNYWVGAALGFGEMQESTALTEETTSAFSHQLEAGFDINEHLGLMMGYGFVQNPPKDDIHLGNIGIIGRIPLIDSFELYGKVGVAYPINVSDDAGFSNTFGVGIEYQINHAVSTKIGVDYYKDLTLNPERFGELYQVHWGMSYRFGQSSSPQVVEIIKEVPVEVIKEVPIEVIKEVVITQPEPKTVVPSKLFANNSSLLLSTKSLEAPLEMLKKDTTLTLTVIGHTDNVGTASYNQWMSERRAKAVAQFFISNGISSSRITQEGRGKSEPIASNNHELGRAQNRRAELIIQPAKRQ